jgi:hypothetical protein
MKAMVSARCAVVLAAFGVPVVAAAAAEESTSALAEVVVTAQKR